MSSETLFETSYGYDIDSLLNFSGDATYEEPDSYSVLIDCTFSQRHTESSGSTYNRSLTSTSEVSSSQSEVTNSPRSPSQVPEPRYQQNGSLQLKWPEDGQLHSSNLSGKGMQLESRPTRPGTPPTPQSPSNLTQPDPHHEGSCRVCRMTEAEARKCRLDRRREQNRASQRKFRARKEAKIKEAAGQIAGLESYVDFLEKHNGELETTNAELKQRLAELEISQARPSTTGPMHLNPVSNSSPMLQGQVAKSKVRSFEPRIEPEMHDTDLYLPLFDHELEISHLGRNHGV